MRRNLALAACVLVVVTLVPAVLVQQVHASSSSNSSHKHSIVSHSIKNDISPALRTIQGSPWHGDGTRADAFPQLAPVKTGHQNHLVAPVQTTIGPLAAPSTSNNFDGVGNGFTGPQGTFTVNAAPPDTNGEVGPHDYVQTVNTDFAVFNKDPSRGTVGTVRYGPVAINTLWSGFGGLCQTDNDGDPTVVYDGIADRWIISQFAVTGANGSSTPYLQCIAVSTSGDPTGTYNRYSFAYSNFPDYPKMAVWPDAYYETYNMFAGGTTFVGAEICAFNRANMLNGTAATQQCFTTNTNFGGLLPSTLDGSTLPPAGSPDYVVGLDTTTSLAFWKFHVDWTTPGNSTFTGPTSLAVASYAQACGGGTCIPQSGTTQQLDSLADRLMYRFAYRNFGDHESLVVDHAITSGSSVGMRWYEIRSPGGTPTVFQQGTYAPDSSYRWMGSIAMDQSGDMAMGFSVSSSSLHPEIHYTGRLATDALNTMPQGEASVIDGAGSQTGQSLSRWGDYSNMAIDPADGCTFWYTNEYIPSNGAFNWKTRIGSFTFPSCGGTTTNDFSISANPTSLSIAQGSSGTSTISTAVTSGSAGTVSLTASVSPAGPTASLNPTSVTAGNSSTLTVNVGSSVAAGTYTVTVTGTEGSATHSTTVTITVTSTAPNDFSISASPTSLSIAQGGSGTSTISTAVTSGTAGTVNLSATVSPAGPTASLNPTSITAGGSSTLTVSVGSSVAAGTYTVTVTGTEGSVTHSTTVSVTVTSSGGGGITNGGFETGSFSGWTTTGTTSISTTAHSGTYSGQAGGTSPTSGDSTISQTFTVPSSGGTLSVWYQVHCPDTVTYDWATITLKDNTSNTTSTLLGRTCTNSGTWQKVSGSLTAGHSVTLTLLSHDDNYPSDPTYTLFDDAAISAPVANPVVNGGFETGSFSGWTTTGTTSISATAHSGTHSGQAGSTSPTSGDSTISQTFTIPSGASTLTFWYQVHCPDTVTYDWATATLKDNTSGTTSTVLSRTCTNSGAWVQVNVNVSSMVGHSVTLTLVSHDDNYPGDATYTLFDDVSVS